MSAVPTTGGLGRVTALLGFCAALLATPVPAAAGDAEVDALAAAFVGQTPPGWSVVEGRWEFLDVEDCFVEQLSCFGNNPSSPYGYPMFQSAPRFPMGPSDALVVFMRTPPQMRYFGFTQYLIRRGVGTPQVLASLGDTLNNLKFVSFDSAAPGQDVHGRLAVLVWTGDLNTQATVAASLAQMGIPSSRANFMLLPAALPLNLGYSGSADIFSLLMRTALPNVQAEFDAYRAQLPFAVLKLVPGAPPPPVPAPVLGYASEATGVPEDPALATALDSLVADIRTNYRKTFALKKQVVLPFLAKGLDCIAGTATCVLDNHDALYSSDLTSTAVTFTNLDDIVIVAGVNHQKTGKSLYMNHSVNDPATSTGVVTIDDTQLSTLSALYHAGVTSAKDPRAKLYRNLYAYAVSYDCKGLKHCLNIPPVTPENPIGLPPGATFGLWERQYVNPLTGVRPDPAEVITQQVLVGTRR
jgi:hypothetical protein